MRRTWGTPRAAWLAASRPLLKFYALPIVGVSLLTKALTGEGLPVRACDTLLAGLSVAVSTPLSTYGMQWALGCHGTQNDSGMP